MKHLESIFKGKQPPKYSTIFFIVYTILNIASVPAIIMEEQANTNPLLIYSLIVGSFFPPALALIYLLKKISERSLTTIINGRDKIRWDRIRFGILIWGIYLISKLGLELIIDPQSLQFQFELTPFIILFVISLILIPFQTSIEEFLTRGMLSQGLSRNFKSRWIILWIVALVFGIIHFVNPESAVGGLWVNLDYITMAIFLGLISMMDDGIELALGVHFINNFLISLLYTEVNGNTAFGRLPSLFSFELGTVPFQDYLISLLGYIVVFLIIKWKFKLKFDTMNKPIEGQSKIQTKNQESLLEMTEEQKRVSDSRSFFASLMLMMIIIWILLYALYNLIYTQYGEGFIPLGSIITLSIFIPLFIIMIWYIIENRKNGIFSIDESKITDAEDSSKSKKWLAIASIFVYLVGFEVLVSEMITGQSAKDMITYTPPEYDGHAVPIEQDFIFIIISFSLLYIFILFMLSLIISKVRLNQAKSNIKNTYLAYISFSYISLQAINFVRFEYIPYIFGGPIIILIMAIAIIIFKKFNKKNITKPKLNE